MKAINQQFYRAADSFVCFHYKNSVFYCVIAYANFANKKTAT